MRPLSGAHCASSLTRVRSSRYSGRYRSKFSSTMTSVPPWMGTACGCAAFICSASGHVAGCRNSIGPLLSATGLLAVRAVRAARIHPAVGHIDRHGAVGQCLIDGIVIPRAAPGPVVEVDQALL